MKKKAVVLLSGGVDSTTTFAVAREMGFDVYALSFDYGQRHLVELEAATKVALALGAKEHMTLKIDMSPIGGSALTDDIDVPKDGSVGSFGDGTGEDIPVTYVPARNTVFLSYGLAWAEVLGTGDIFIGANAVDYSGYPDCRPEYLSAYEAMANLAIKAAVEGKFRVKVHAPLLRMSKAEIIKRGLELGVDFDMTFSCYDPGPDGLPCLRCDSCLIRQQGMRESGEGR